MVMRSETRAERQAFLAHLATVSEGDRVRLLKEHRDFLDGERATDADLGSARPCVKPVAAPRRPPMGKDAAYLRANKRSVAETRQAVAKKTLAGSGKKRMAQRKEDDDESWEPDDDAEDDAGEDADEEEEEEPRKAPKVKAAKRKKRAGKKSAADKTKDVAVKPRKKNARTLAKEARLAAAAAKKSAAAKERQDQASLAQRAGKAAKAAARRRLEETTTAKKRKSAAKETSASAEETTTNGKKRRTSPHDTQPHDGEDEPASPSLVSSEAEANARLVPAITSEATSPCDNVEIAPEPSPVSSVDETLNSDCDEDEEEIFFVDENDDFVELEAVDETAYGNDAPAESPIVSGSEESGRMEALHEEAGINEFDWPVLDNVDMLSFARDVDGLANMRKTGWELDPSSFPHDQRYPGLYDEPFGPSDEVVTLADSPLDLFLFFMPKSLWREVARQSTLYHDQHLVERVDRMHAKQRVQGQKSKEFYMERESRKEDIKAHEVVVLLGLLIARMINPQRRHFYDHWATSSVGAVAAGTFGRYLKRNRFTHILSNLHFTDNADARAGTDRAWKIRSVVDALQQSFLRGYKTPPVLALDEAMIPLHNRHNPTRQYVANKPHKWGTKLFMTCCAETSYCLRLEVYCGKAQHTQEIGNVPESMQSIDHNTGPAAVMRSLEAVLPPPVDDVYHLVVTDRFYTSVQLAYQLLQRQVYCVGTIQDDRQGFSDALVENNRDRPKCIPHGTTRMAVAKNCPLMTGLVWWDRRPVTLLGTGGSRSMESCMRWRPGGIRAEVPCPSMMRDYHRWMGGVDVHDQLRLQRYSLQQQTKCKKYYKAVFLGLVDVAIVNAYIVYREVQKRHASRSNTHAEFLLQLQAQMLDLDEEDFAQRHPVQEQSTSIPNTLPAVHVPRESPDFQIVNGQRKRRQRQCKVCSNSKRHVGERRATKYYCPGCSPSDKARTYLCNKVWPHFKNNTLTCHQIWHHQWKNGEERPRPRCGRDIQHREAGGSDKKRKRRRQEGDRARSNGSHDGGSEREDELAEDTDNLENEREEVSVEGAPVISDQEYEEEDAGGEEE